MINIVVIVIGLHKICTQSQLEWSLPFPFSCFALIALVLCKVQFGNISGNGKEGEAIKQTLNSWLQPLCNSINKSLKCSLCL